MSKNQIYVTSGIYQFIKSSGLIIALTVAAEQASNLVLQRGSFMQLMWIFSTPVVIVLDVDLPVELRLCFVTKITLLV